MTYIIWQLVALGVLILGIGFIGAWLMPEEKKENPRVEYGKQKNKLYLVPLDEVSRDLADWLGPRLSGRLNIKTSSGIVAKLPEESFNPSRGGYFSSIILNKLQFLKSSDTEFILSITDEDLFTPGTDFIFSGSDRLAGVSIISTQRLKPEFYGLPSDNEILRIRAQRRAIHEIGHLLGLNNCEDTNCVMYSAKTIIEIDYQSDRFCQRCIMVLTIPDKVPKT